MATYRDPVRVFAPLEIIERLLEIRAAPARPLVDVVVDEVDHVARASVAARLHALGEPLAPVLLARGAVRLGRAVGVEDEYLAGVNRQVVFVVARVAEEAQGETAALDEAAAAVGVQNQRGVVAGVDEEIGRAS